MKRLLSFFMIISLLFVVNTISTSATSLPTDSLSEEMSKDFSDNDYKGLNKDEIFVAKLEEMNIPSSFHSILHRNSYNAICEAKTISTTTQYYVESDKNGQLIQKSKTDYKKAVATEKSKVEQQKALLENQLQKNTSLTTPKSLIPSPGLTSTISNGTLTLIIILSTSDGVNYTCTGLFEWETMPSTRLTDAFGLSRSVLVTVNEQSAFGGYETQYTIIRSTISGNVSSNYTETIDVPFEELEPSTTGYAFEYIVPKDISQIEPTYSATMFNHIVGLIQYSGYVSLLDVTGVNHWATYAHKKINIIFNNIDFSVPFEKKFSITFGSTYEQLSEEHTWRRNV